MAKHRDELPQLGGALFLTDGGLETTLIFHDGLELPHFAAFHLLQTPEGEAVLRTYFRAYAALARKSGTGLILESATWRANAVVPGMKVLHDASAQSDTGTEARCVLPGVRPGAACGIARG